MRKLVATIVVILLAGIGGTAYYRYRNQKKPPEVTTAAVSRGEIVDAVGATGTIEAVTTVQVGTQVSGTILSLSADFNSIVHKGQVIARLDPSLFQTQIEQARANLSRAEADVQRLQVELDDARTKLTRAQNLAARNLIARQDLDAAEIAVRSAEAQLRSSQAQVTQARASLNQNDVNLQHTVIEAPIDGIVISRNVDVGQTVAASMQAPTLFILAADLTKMQVKANIDEADVGRIRPGQRVRFRVDAFPSDEFLGTVSQIRLQPTVVQNVVTYSTVIDVPNQDLRLKPGMTANVNIEIARRADAVRVPNAALRFRPTPDTFAALGQETPPDLQRARSGNRGSTAGNGASTPGAPVGASTTTASQPTAAPAARPGAAPAGSGSGARPDTGAAVPADAARPQRPARGAQGGATGPVSPDSPAGTAPAGEARPGGTTAGAPAGGASPQGGGERAASPGGEGGGGGWASMDPEERRKRMQERLATMTPEEREQFLQRLRDRGVDVSGLAAGGGTAAAPAAPAGAAAHASAKGGAPAAPRATGTGAPQPAWQRAQTIDALFGPLPTTVTPGRAWLYANSQLKMLRLRLGISDGMWTEVLNEEVTPGMELVTNVVVDTTKTAATGGRSPLMGQQPGRGGPPGVRNAAPQGR